MVIPGYRLDAFVSQRESGVKTDMEK